MIILAFAICAFLLIGYIVRCGVIDEKNKAAHIERMHKDGYEQVLITLPLDPNEFNRVLLGPPKSELVWRKRQGEEA